MKKNILYSCVLLITMISSAFSQTKQGKVQYYFKVAEQEFSDQRYTYAIPFYEYYLTHITKTDSVAGLHLAECFWHTKNYDSSLLYFQQFESKNAPTFLSRQRIAELLAIKNQHSTAAKIYKDLESKYPGQNARFVKERAQGFNTVVSFLRDSLDYSIQPLSLNTPQQDFSPQFYKWGMVFLSNRYNKATTEKEFGWDGLPFSNIFWVRDTADLYTGKQNFSYTKSNVGLVLKANDDYTKRTSNDNDIILLNGFNVKKTNSKLQVLERFSDQLNAKYNYGPLCFSKKGNIVYFTRNSLSASNHRYNLEVCSAELVNGKWQNIQVLPFVEPAYDFFHPALNNDETKLYFCSNKPGGFGGSDIYFVDIQTGSDMKSPVNLGEVINTAGNELFPTVQSDILYFSSDGLAGMGGLDIYESHFNAGKWSAPKNIGYPVNSTFDDFGLILNNAGKKGFFTSNRLGSDDIYSFAKERYQVKYKGTVLNKANSLRLEGVKIVLYSNEPGSTAIDSLTTDHTGNYAFTVRPGNGYTIKFTKQDFTGETITVKAVGKEKEINADPVLLAPIPKPKAPEKPKELDRDGDGIPDAMDKCPDVAGIKENFGCPDIQKKINELAKMVFFNTASAQLKPEAYKPLNEVLDILKLYPMVTIAIEGHTDNRANAAYNKVLSKQRANTVLSFFVTKGLDRSRFTAEGFGLEKPIADNNTQAGRAMNRRVSIVATFH